MNWTFSEKYSSRPEPGPAIAHAPSEIRTPARRPFTAQSELKRPTWRPVNEYLLSMRAEWS